MSRAGTLALLAAGAVLAWVASAQAWWLASGGPSRAVLTGDQVSGNLTDALAAVAGAGLLLVLVLRRPGRRALGAVLALVGLAMLGAAAYRFRPDDATVLARLRESGLVDQVSVSATAWPWLYAAAGALELAGAVALLVGTAEWPARTDRFARRSSAGTSARATSAGPTAPGDDALLTWRALDAGVDPTLDPQSALGSTPDVRSPSAGDTMGDRYDKQGFVNPPERRTS